MKSGLTQIQSFIRCVFIQRVTLHAISALQLMESGIQNKLVAELYLPIPEPSHMSGRVELESFEFSSDQQVFYKHEGVGSGE